MKAITGAALLLGLVATTARAGLDDPKFDEAKLIGKWEPTDTKKETRATLEFKKAGKLVVTIPIDGVDTIVEGTWKLKGVELEIGMTRNGMTESTVMKLTKLDDKTLEYTAPQGKNYSLKKMKS
jgi:uncharacterized protein (TIGR03066 family)